MKTQQPLSPLRRFAKAIWHRKLWLQRSIMITACAAFTLIVIVQIVVRYFLFIPIHGLEEMAVYIAIWTYFIGGAYGAYERTHISANLLQLFIKNPRVNRWVKISANSITVIVAVWMSVWTFQYLSWSIHMSPRSLELGASLYWVHGAMFCGMALMSVYFIIELIDNLRLIFYPLAKNSASNGLTVNNTINNTINNNSER